MTTFSIQDFAAGCKASMAQAQDKQAAAKDFLEATLREHAPADILAALEAAIPAGASIGEMIVHQSAELTMLYARVPANFRSGIHNHTVFACMGQLVGEERSTIYEPTSAGGLRVTESVAITTGAVMTLPADAIHHIENPTAETSAALHLYGGDFSAIEDQRSLWSSDSHTELPFSFPALIQESVAAMKQEGNDRGLDALVAAIPAVAPMVSAP